MDNREMVKRLRETGFLFSPIVEKAMLSIDRKIFVPERYAEDAYYDVALPIKNQSTISAPGIVAFMLSHLDLKKGQNVLEVGAGSGYNAAIIAKIISPGKLTTTEIDAEVLEIARNNLARFNFKNIELVHCNGSVGYEKNAPYDRIIVTGAMPRIPESLKSQLKPDGLLLSPVGQYFQKLVLFSKSTNEYKELLDVVFVPIVGKDGFKP
ncbi:MAG: protein-L-isoaspartate(D-aspartate) O-methyltransferase [Candidatus Anstonellales archaeon]